MTVSGNCYSSIFPKFKAIAKREGLTPGELTEQVLIEYVNAHDTGNPQHKLPNFLQDPDFVATPALFRDHHTILKYLRTIKGTDMEQKVNSKINEWVDCINEADDDI